MIVTLLTDFGTADHFVAAMKGVILSRDPTIRIVDISHHVPRGDIATGAFLLAQVAGEFPPGTVHLAVVDPGVGSSRRALAASAGGRFFVAPDNGLCDHALRRDRKAVVRAIENVALMRAGRSRTFHGRDVFAPVAAALAQGYSLADVGPVVEDRVVLAMPEPELLPSGEVRGEIQHIDTFGNAITTLRPSDLPGGPAAYRYRIGPHRVVEVRSYFGEGESTLPFLIVGSAGVLEVAINGDSAADRLGLRRGDRVTATPAGAAGDRAALAETGTGG